MHDADRRCGPGSPAPPRHGAGGRDEAGSAATPPDAGRRCETASKALPAGGACGRVNTSATGTDADRTALGSCASAARCVGRRGLDSMDPGNVAVRMADGRTDDKTTHLAAVRRRAGRDVAAADDASRVLPPRCGYAAGRFRPFGAGPCRGRHCRAPSGRRAGSARPGRGRVDAARRPAAGRDAMTGIRGMTATRRGDPAACDRCRPGAPSQPSVRRGLP